MTKNPYKVFEKTAKLLWKIVFTAFWVALLGALLIAAPIVGFIEGWPWHMSWIGWILAALVVLIVLVMWPVLWLTEKIYRRWEKSKSDWERKNRVGS